MCKHLCPGLNQAYKGYQGQKPDAAKFVFIGIDANFSPDIQNSPIFKEVLDYLADGVAYWKTNKRHHPFLSPLYKRGIGYKYHLSFSKMGLTCEYADKISFVELLPYPTCGNTSKQFMHLFNDSENVDHLKKIDSWIRSSGNIKDVFISRGVYTKMHNLGKYYKCFEWLPDPDNFKLNNIYTFQLDNNKGLRVITHFSDAISDTHLKEIGMIIQ